MAYDEGLAERLREVFSAQRDIVEKKMFGGLAFMWRGNMCCGIVDDTLMARVGAEYYAEALKSPHAREMDFTGKVMKVYVYIAPAGFEDDVALQSWVELCLRFVATLPAK